MSNMQFKLWREQEEETPGVDDLTAGHWFESQLEDLFYGVYVCGVWS